MVNIIIIPVKLLFNIAVFIKNWCYNNGMRKVHQFDIPIISIGNITFGGTGKTPMVITLSKKLKLDGYHPAIISRGYKRKSQGLVVVNDGNGTVAEAHQGGDEPYLISQKLENVPVIVCKKREQAVDYIIKNFKDVNVVLLDDGFQYRRLNRNVDVVLLSGSECSAILREPKSALDRADVVLTLEKEYSIFEFNNDTFIASKPASSVYAFCGIANPDPFFDFIHNQGISISGQSIFIDHFEYSPQSINELQSSIEKSSTDSIITTEKDLVKLSDEFLNQYQVYIVTLDIILKDDIYNQIIKGIKNS